MRYDASDLRSMPTLCVGQADDLKVDDGSTRVWLSRCGVADGLPSDNLVTVENLVDGRWVTAEVYNGFTCEQCDTPMNPVDAVLGTVCGACTRKNHREAVGR